MKYQDLRRLAVALACSLALHEALVAMIPAPRLIKSDDEAIVARVTIARIVRTPTPKPTPTPAPLPVRKVSQVSSGVHARVEHVKAAGAKRPTPPKAVEATPDAPVPTGGQGAGEQNGSAAGSLSDVNGNGSGTATAGNGSGAGICGAVDFESTGLAKYDPQSGDYERSNIIATVYYADGSSQRIPLDWTWNYKSESVDPFASSAPMLFQFPPVQQRASEPAPIQYIIAHTTADGRTKLNDRCPNIPPPPSASPQPHEETRQLAGRNRPAEMKALGALAG
ncbi:MAG TPA: hypothetical protein VMV65_10250 [Alphaproteobacteria bacterium]|nr:hypothetical protein [Alphaproteobacteria bacterium]